MALGDVLRPCLVDPLHLAHAALSDAANLPPPPPRQPGRVVGIENNNKEANQEGDVKDIATATAAAASTSMTLTQNAQMSSRAQMRRQGMEDVPVLGRELGAPAAASRGKYSPFRLRR